MILVIVCSNASVGLRLSSHQSQWVNVVCRVCVCVCNNVLMAGGRAESLVGNDLVASRKRIYLGTMSL
jgi:hypothetical protein